MNKLYLLAILAFCASCSSRKEGFRVAASATPHAEMLEFIAPDLEAQGIHLVVVVTDDYNLPNRALAEKEVDANFFQHAPYLESQIDQFHYKIKSLAAIEIEPMGIYSKKIKYLSEIRQGAQIAIPNDPSNGARALLLLQEQGLIKLSGNTVHQIVDNKKNIQFIEVDAPMLPRTLADVDAAIINTNYALGAGLSPLKDALVLESKESPYANIIAIRIGDEENDNIAALKVAMTSEKMRAFIQEKYKGAILPAFYTQTTSKTDF